LEKNSKKKMWWADGGGEKGAPRKNNLTAPIGPFAEGCKQPYEDIALKNSKWEILRNWLRGGKYHGRKEQKKEGVYKEFDRW